ncbi:UDP-2,4-diacetamido-2,4,6-trideoxy-beta-L-altropyranose hydrolase [Rhodocyclus tenuis]|uniref:UDP-2,4-diacetamido-2,4, 6-trideoxy-beta-L-altropyranose hydrolase n=1 Tax=Rhodocyclus tenuis TaxID=1066 RepID=A0A840G5M6_RHOTE|nr:UDP-2,4-diacetamido-2,4,6-trideoxy-beta-L-altropyranose hydrolase [Rhodocyclus tenuis]MBB4246661.1 UDP-2,4-diacetamido-2,4,6-trideoxy-beta-L-altropyranose hydrolase [Rhodocyclus tenuis]
MDVVFRTDAALQIGTGHLMRCLTLADRLRRDGARCRFVCRAHPGHLLGLIAERGHAGIALPYDPAAADAGTPPPAHAAWLGATWQADARATTAALGDDRVDWLVADHYALDARWEAALRPRCRELMVIDDLADRPHDCDLLLDQNLGRSAADYAGRVPAACRVLAGPQHALLRPEFAALHERLPARRRPARLGHLLLNMGGVDPDNVTGEALAALRGCTLPDDCRITVVMGRNAPAIDAVRAQAAQLPWATDLRVNVPNMASLMADCDLAIGAAGSTSWERCCLGLPALLVVLADNQRPIADALQAAGAAQAIARETLAAELRAFLQRADLGAVLDRMREKAAAITDGRGTARVAGHLGGFAA